MKILSSIWKYIAIAAGLAATVLYAMFRVTKAGKGKAEEKAEGEEAKRKGVEATREKERNASEAAMDARERAQEVDRENEKQRRTGVRRDTFGDSRLRDKD